MMAIFIWRNDVQPDVAALDAQHSERRMSNQMSGTSRTGEVAEDLLGKFPYQERFSISEVYCIQDF